MEDTYTLLQIFARSWGTIFMFTAFICVLVIAFRPGSRRIHSDAASVPFLHEDAPVYDEAED